LTFKTTTNEAVAKTRKKYCFIVEAIKPYIRSTVKYGEEKEGDLACHVKATEPSALPTMSTTSFKKKPKKPTAPYLNTSNTLSKTTRPNLQLTNPNRLPANHDLPAK
jgi:hypothetical protein